MRTGAARRQEEDAPQINGSGAPECASRGRAQYARPRRFSVPDSGPPKKNAGSITVGKVADLVLVEGDPSKRIGDLRNTRKVLMDGKLMDADALRAAAGFSGRPHAVD